MLKHFKIGTRLSIGFGILLAVFIGLAIFSIFTLKGLSSLTQKLYNHPYTVSNAMREANTHIIKMHRSMKDVAMAEDETQIEKAVIAVNESEKIVLEKLAEAEKQFLGEKIEIKTLIENFRNWKPIRDEVFRFIREGKKAEAAAITKGKGAVYVDGLEKGMTTFIDFAQTKAEEFLADAGKSEKNAVLVMVLVTLFILILALLITYFITTSITRPLNKAVYVAKHLAENDISIDIDVPDSKDEPGMLLRAMKEMLENLRVQIRELMEGINVLASSAGEISTTTTQLAASFSEIASSINETVTSVKEVKQTSDLSNQKAKFMADSSRNVLQVSQSGGKAVEETVQAMNSIQEQMVSIAESIVGLSERNQSIGEIITVVDDIAEQSRLLAVNASIEAVKAGEQGKGFSVVAAEIKNLAQQSKQSTTQVRSILAEIQKATSNSVMVTEKGNKTVDSGVRQARQTGEAIDALGKNIAEASQASMQIEATSRQQTAGIDQIFSAMENINVAIRQNADGAKQMEAAAHNLKDLGNKLKNLVERYKV